MASYALDQRIWRGSSSGFHLTNLLLHLGVCALVFVLAIRSGAGSLHAGLATALFGVLPRLTEVVGITTNRADLLAGLGALGCLALHRCAAGSLAWKCVAAGALLFGLLSKEVAAAGFVALVASGGWWQRRGRDLVPATVAMAVYATLRLSAIGRPSLPDTGGIGDRAVFALQALGEYAWMLIDPLRPRLRIGILGIHEPEMIVLGLAVVAGLAWTARGLCVWRRESVLPGFLALAVAALLPVLHLVPFRIDSVAADRFLYLPAAALAVLAAIGLRRVPSRFGSAASGCTAVFVVVCAGVTYARVADWTSEERFWQTAAEGSPEGDAVPLMALGGVHARAGEFRRTLDLYEQALARAREIPPVLASVTRRREAIAGIAHAYLELGEPEKAVPPLRELVAESPGRAGLRYQLALAEAQRFEFAAAEKQLGTLLTLAPGDPEGIALLEGVRRAGRAWDPHTPMDLETSEAEALERLAETFTGSLLNERAAAFWAAVARHDGATTHSVRRAAVFLALRGTVDQGRKALAHLRARTGETNQLRSLEAAWKQRVASRS